MISKIAPAFITVCSSLSCMGQSGPGGIGSSANNKLWLRIDSNVYSDAGITAAVNTNQIAQWEDYSGNNFHAVQTTANFRPVFRTNQINGFAALEFDGNDDRILSTGLPASGNMIVFTVVQPTSYTNNNDGIIQGSPAGQAFSSTTTSKSVGMWIDRASSRPWGRGVQSNSTQINIPTTTTISTGQYYIITNDYTGSTIQQYINGGTAGSAAYNGTLNGWSDFGIGRQGTESFTGRMMEIIVYNTTLNPAQRIIIDNYLAAKFNLTLASNDIYTMDNGGNDDYDFEVAGIGRAANATQTQTTSQGSGIVRIVKSGGGLGNNEYLIWGHEGGILNSFGFTDVPSGVDARLGRKWRVSEQGEVGDIDIDFDLSGLGPVTTTDLRLLIDSDGNGDFSNSTAYSGASSLGSNLYRFSVTADQLDDGFGFTIATINASQTPLPIVLLYFAARMEGEGARLEWSTASEINNARFAIERSPDNETWGEIGTISGAGNSRQIREYTYLDRLPLTGTNYYRLKQVDYNGTFSYSQVEIVDFDMSTRLPYPNPTKEMLFVALQNPSFFSLRLFGTDGKQAEATNHVNGNSAILNLEHLEPGTYILEVKDGTVVYYRKIALHK